MPGRIPGLCSPPTLAGVAALEPSRYVLGASRAYGGSLGDRAAEIRGDETAVDRAWADQRSRVLVVGHGRALLDDSGLVLLTSEQAPDGQRILLGRQAGGGFLFAVRRDDAGADERARGLRSAATLLSAEQLGVLMHAVALANWHETHPRCARCGTATVSINAGYARRCPSDGSEHYPRTDPAVIVLVLDGGPPGEDRALLGRQASWPLGRFSTLAGFVEPGETVEEAVAREVAEEVGLPVSTVGYAGSQPWPFPASLMLAYYAVAAPGHRDDAAVFVDGEEIVEARWFDRAGLADALADGSLVVPPGISVARRLIEGWYGAALHSGGVWR